MRIDSNNNNEKLESFLNHCHRKVYPNKTTLIHSGDISQTLYYIISGSVTVSVDDDDGHEIIVAFINAGGIYW
jgi:CRP/FNR family transcriptional regulator, cyclic AMP receptor protein